MANANPTTNDLHGVARDVQAVLSALNERDIEHLVEAASAIQCLGKELKDGQSSALNPYAIGTTITVLGRHVEDLSHSMLRCLRNLERMLKEQTEKEAAQ